MRNYSTKYNIDLNKRKISEELLYVLLLSIRKNAAVIYRKIFGIVKMMLSKPKILISKVDLALVNQFRLVVNDNCNGGALDISGVS